MQKKFFEAIINKKASTQSNSIIPNSSEVNAISALVKMFELATKSIQLLVGAFDCPIPNNPQYKEAIENAIKERGVRVDIVFTSQPDPNSEVFQSLLNLRSGAYSKQIGLRIISENAKRILNNEIDNDGDPFFYAVSDKIRYRFEKDIIKHTAWINYRDELRSERLSEVFEEVYNDSNEIEEQILAEC